jgi:hypothetical protein
MLCRLLNAGGGGYKGPQADCGRGHKARFVEFRGKGLLTVLGPVRLRRAYYWCEACGGGLAPKDEELDVVKTGFSPGVRRMIGRVGAKEPFDEGRRDLEELAGLTLTAKALERVAEALGEQVESACKSERRAAMAGKLRSMEPPAPVQYIAVDGTGVPVRPSEAAGRVGKQGGQAKTREAKLGCIFTQSGVDSEGCPVRDPSSSSYVAAIEPAEAFGARLYAEAMRRGLEQAGQAVVIGDGAPWIWALAEEHFPGAVQILDVYHARERVWEVGKAAYAGDHDKAADWAAKCCRQMGSGQLQQVIASMRHLNPAGKEAQEAVRKGIGYLTENASRMRYREFRRQGHFIGSGVVEAGCKTVVAQRLKRSGMRWTVRGANSIIALRCCQLSGRWEDFWELRAAS